MRRRTYWWIAAALVPLLFLVTGASGVKCTHCAYINNEPCHSVVCEGAFCVAQVTVDTRAMATLVHKSCEDMDPVEPIAFADNKGHRCQNSTKGDVLAILCSCQADFCTSTLGKEDAGGAAAVEAALEASAGASPPPPGGGAEGGAAAAPPEGLGGAAGGGPAVATPNASEIAQAAGAIPPEAAAPAPSNASAAVIPAESNATAVEAATVATPNASQIAEAVIPSEGAPPPPPPDNTSAALMPAEANPTAIETTTGPPVSALGVIPGVPNPNENLTAAETATSISAEFGNLTTIPPGVQPEVTLFAPIGGEPNTTAAPPSTVFDLFGAASPSAVPAAIGTTEETPTTNATSVDLFFGVPPVSPSASSPPIGETTPAGIEPIITESIANASNVPALEATTVPGLPGLPGQTPPSVVEAPVGGGNLSVAPGGAEVNTSAGIAAMAEVVNERVIYFSAVSLQRLPPYLSSDVVLTPEKQHYDVLSGRLDGDMSFNKNQLDDIVESEHIYLSPKPVNEVESVGPDEFNGVLIGRDLENVNAWKTLEPVPYTFTGNVDQPTRDLVKAAIELWQNNTCTSFNETTGPAGEYILQIDSQLAPNGAVTCGAATVGRWPQVDLLVWQSATPGTGCLTVGTIAHELGHILGLWHAQSRFDAYAFVYVMADANGQVDVHPQSASQSNFDVGYDYGSIMHFNLDALKPKDPRYNQTIGQKREPSFVDYKTIDLQQRCLELCPPLKCFVGGYPTPPGCSKCRCPSGFGGDHCEKVQPSVGECGPTVGSRFATNDWTEISITFTTEPGPTQENKCFWHLWGSGGSQVELDIVNVSLHYAPVGCTDDLTGERNFIEIKIGDNDADNTYDFQRTGFRACNNDIVNEIKRRPIVSSNRLIVLAAYAAKKGSFTLRYRNVGGGNAGLASSIQASALVSPVRQGIQVSSNASESSSLTLEAAEEDGAQQVNPEASCDVRRSLVPGDRLVSPCRKIQSYYGRYSYVFTKKGHHRIYYNEKYFEPRILVFEARQKPPLKKAALINSDNGVLHIEDEAGAKLDPFPYFLSAEKQQALGSLKLVITEDGRLVARSLNGTEVTVVCLAHFACVRLQHRLQSAHGTSNDTRVMLQGGVLYSDNRLFFTTLDTTGELTIWQREKSTDALSTATSKSIWKSGTTPNGRAGQPYRLLLEKNGFPTVRDGDNIVVWQTNGTLAANQLPTSLALNDQGKLVLADAQGSQVWNN